MALAIRIKWKRQGTERDKNVAGGAKEREGSGRKNGKGQTGEIRGR